MWITFSFSEIQADLEQQQQQQQKKETQPNN